MATMGRSGRGRSRASGRAAAASAEPDAEPATDARTEEETRLTEEFAREFEFRDAESDLASMTLGLQALSRPSFPELHDEYAALWTEMAIRRERLAEADALVQRILANKERYRAVEASAAVPWYVVAVLHSLEASLNFRTHLHNGDPLTARTVHVPAGRPAAGQPPFGWEESAMDALAFDGLTANTDWSIERIAYLLERFNGWGYRRHHPEVKSPYLWSFSNHYTRGKYVADNKWSPTAVSGQCGAMVLLRRLDDQGAIRAARAIAPAAPTRTSALSTSRPYAAESGSGSLFATQGSFSSASPVGSTWAALESVAAEDDLDPGCESDLQAEPALAAARVPPPDMPKPVPEGDPAPFAQSSVPPSGRHWPVNSSNGSRLVVSYESVRGQMRGSQGRRFLAQRNGGARFHVGVDLFANTADEVVACEDGQIVAFYPFYPSSAGEMTFALLVEHASFVINYGEVKADSPQRFGWRTGDWVRSGQPIARVSSTSMTHFETYRRGTRRNARWLPGRPRPPELLNPTAYLLELTSG